MTVQASILCLAKPFPVHEIAEEDPTKPYLHFEPNYNDTCFQIEHGDVSYISMDPETCGDIGTMIHEIMYALGFDHEHNRYDRDEYVEILEENITEDLDQYEKEESMSTANTFTPCDYESVMHYPPVTDGKREMRLLKACNESRVGNAKNLSCLDRIKLKRFYQCYEKVERCNDGGGDEKCRRGLYDGRYSFCQRLGQGCTKTCGLCRCLDHDEASKTCKYCDGCDS